MHAKLSLQRFLKVLALAASLSVLGAHQVYAASKPKAPPLIRDAEIEGLLRLYTKPIFKAAGLTPGAVKVYIINGRPVNAFVAGGQRIFINTGTLMQAMTPNEVIGILAHETGHISGGHLARLQVEIDKVSTVNIIGMLAGVAAMAGGAVAGDAQTAKAGQGIMLGGQGLSQRLVLNYARAMEASADQAAVKFLNATGQSSKGMLEVFQRLATQSMASVQNANPYLQSHPMPMDRIRNLEVAARKSPHFDKADTPALVLRHELVRAKLVGFLEPIQTVFQKYPKSDQGLPARYARAIAMFRSGDTRNALPIIDSLIDDIPKNPYFWELKGQALLEGGQPAKAVAPLKEAIRLLPDNGLIQLLYAQALLGQENAASARTAIGALNRAKRSESQTPSVHKFLAMAYGQAGDIPRADLATAEAALLQGDRDLATTKAKIAMASFKKGSPEWLRANDILNFAQKK
jgi:predicted Zn-dependent protease